MTDTQQKGRFRTWLTYIQKNPGHFIVSLILYIFPLLTIFARTIEIFERYFVVFIIFLAILIFINQLQNLQEIEENQEKDRHIRELESKIAEYSTITSAQKDIQATVPNILMAHIHSELGLSANERITLYEYYSGNFTSIGRYSTNPKLRDLNDKLSAGDGIVGKCYSSQSPYCSIENLPDYEENPVAYTDALIKAVDISKNKIKTQSMKSRAQFAKTIQSTEASGVLVIESAGPSLSSPADTLNTQLESSIAPFLAQIIDLNRDIEMAGLDHKKLKATLAYIYKHYPTDHLDKLNKSTLNQLIYLIDYQHCKKEGHSITSSPWTRHAYGAYSESIDAAMKTHKDLKYLSTNSIYNKPKGTLDSKIPKEMIDTSALTENEKSTIQTIIDQYASLELNDLVKKSDETTALSATEQFGEIDLSK